MKAVAKSDDTKRLDWIMDCSVWEFLKIMNKIAATDNNQDAREAIDAAMQSHSPIHDTNDTKRLADALERISSVIDSDKNAFRMVDIDRANVYKTHLGGKLSGDAAMRKDK